MDHGLELTEDTPVGQIAAASTRLRRLLDELGIDYCCHGDRPLIDAAREAFRNVDTVLAALRCGLSQPVDTDARDWSGAPLGEMVDHIIATFHVPLREALPRLVLLATRVRGVHDAAHGDVLRPLTERLEGLGRDLLDHMTNEERTLFPLARWVADGGSPAPAELTAAIDELRGDHDRAGTALAELRRLTNGYDVPGDACPSFRALYEDLALLERDLHEHVHLENNVLFPRLVKDAGKVRTDDANHGDRRKTPRD